MRDTSMAGVHAPIQATAVGKRLIALEGTLVLVASRGRGSPIRKWSD